MTMPRRSTRFPHGIGQAATDRGRVTLKKEYNAPELELIALILDGVCAEVIHSSFEHGGNNSGWNWNDDDDDENFGELP